MESVRSRLLKSFAASALGPIVTSIFQVVTVPLYLRSWGTHLYGEWLILSAIPSYLSLTDFGFASVASNTMTMDVARGNKDEAIITFQSAWLLTAIVGMIIVVLVALTTIFVPLHDLLHFTVMTEGQVRWIFVLLCLWVLVGLQSNINQAAFRCDGNYAFGMLSINIVRMVETVGVSAAIFFKASPVVIAAIMLAVRVGGVVVNRINLLSRSPWIAFHFKHASMKRARALFLPALGYMAFPIGDAISLQGFTLAAGMELGPVLVVTFSTLRTLTRLIIQVIRIIMYSMAPELSRSYGVGNMAETRKLHHLSCQLSLWSSLSISLVLALGGDTLLKIWTHGRIQMDHATYWMLLLVVVANSVWHGSSALLLASNEHNRAAVVYIFATVVSLGLAIVLMKLFSLPGAAVSLLLIDIVYGAYVVRVSLKMLNEKASTWLLAILHPPGRLPHPQRALS